MYSKEISSQFSGDKITACNLIIVESSFVNWIPSRMFIILLNLGIYCYVEDIRLKFKSGNSRDSMRQHVHAQAVKRHICHLCSHLAGKERYKDKNQVLRAEVVRIYWIWQLNLWTFVRQYSFTGNDIKCILRLCFQVACQYDEQRQ